MSGTSSFTEGSSVFGGQANLLQAINNIFSIYNPDIIAVHTTCLSETIGDDIPQIVNKAQTDGKIPRREICDPREYTKLCRFPYYGFANMVKSLVDYFSESDPARMRSPENGNGKKKKTNQCHPRLG